MRALTYAETDLVAAYAMERPALRVNFVASADGAATLDGRSGGLGNANDQHILGLLRQLADVLVVGAGTLRAEGYGPLVLGDGGVVCIDEFDKMDDRDRVAIHEAMEQQTISIAKAGITAVLNARAAVLAAANPLFGRFNDRMTVNDNINLNTTILSRFDMIFLLRDRPSKEHDRMLVRHIVAIHRDGVKEDTIPADLLRSYINYCKTSAHGD